MIEHADDRDFARVVEGQTGIILVEFYTSSCQPCRQLEPHLRMLDENFNHRVKVVKVDSTMASRTAREYGVRMAPTLILFVNGKPVDAIQGNPNSYEKLVSFVERYL